VNSVADAARPYSSLADDAAVAEAPPAGGREGEGVLPLLADKYSCSSRRGGEGVSPLVAD
jgi:hypothetical protein